MFSKPSSVSFPRLLKIPHVRSGLLVFRDISDFDNYLRDVDYMPSMQLEECDGSLLSRLLHFIDKSRFGTECIVVDS